MQGPVFPGEVQGEAPHFRVSQAVVSSADLTRRRCGVTHGFPWSQHSWEAAPWGSHSALCKGGDRGTEQLQRPQGARTRTYLGEDFEGEGQCSEAVRRPVGLLPLRELGLAAVELAAHSPPLRWAAGPPLRVADPVLPSEHSCCPWLALHPDPPQLPGAVALAGALPCSPFSLAPCLSWFPACGSGHKTCRQNFSV